MAVLLRKKVKIAFLPVNIRNKEGRNKLVVDALGRFLNTHDSASILYQMKAEIIYFVFRGYKNMSLHGKCTTLRFQDRCSYNTVHCRC